MRYGTNIVGLLSEGGRTDRTTRYTSLGPLSSSAISAAIGSMKLDPPYELCHIE